MSRKVSLLCLFPPFIRFSRHGSIYSYCHEHKSEEKRTRTHWTTSHRLHWLRRWVPILPDWICPRFLLPFCLCSVCHSFSSILFLSLSVRFQWTESLLVMPCLQTFIFVSSVVWWLLCLPSQLWIILTLVQLCPSLSFIPLFACTREGEIARQNPCFDFVTSCNWLFPFSHSHSSNSHRARKLSRCLSYSHDGDQSVLFEFLPVMSSSIFLLYSNRILHSPSFITLVVYFHCDSSRFHITTHPSLIVPLQVRLVLLRLNVPYSWEE